MLSPLETLNILFLILAIGLDDDGLVSGPPCKASLKSLVLNISQSTLFNSTLYTLYTKFGILLFIT